MLTDHGLSLGKIRKILIFHHVPRLALRWWKFLLKSSENTAIQQFEIEITQYHKTLSMIGIQCPPAPLKIVVY